MSRAEHLGLRILMWIEQYLLRDSLSDEDNRRLGALRTSLYILHGEIAQELGQ